MTKKKTLYIFCITFLKDPSVSRSLLSRFLFQHFPPCSVGPFSVSTKQVVLVYSPLSDRQAAKSSFWVQRVRTHGTCGRNSECSSRADSRQSLKHYCSWPWLISLRQAEPQEAKCSALARPFWFALDVRLFDIMSFGCALFVSTSFPAVVYTSKRQIKPGQCRWPGCVFLDDLSLAIFHYSEKDCISIVDRDNIPSKCQYPKTISCI